MEALSKLGFCKIDTNLFPPDSHLRQWDCRELLQFVMQAAGVTLALSYFFYRSIWAIGPMSVIGFFYFRNLLNGAILKKQERMEMEFKECILAVASSMRAGYAAENAFRECEQDMRLLFGEDSLIVHELEIIRRGLIMNVPLEELLSQFANRSNREVIHRFADVFLIAKRSGGDLAEIMQSTAELIRNQIEVKEEVATVLSGRRMELNIMKAMPFGILAYISVTTPGYFETLYGNLKGILLMTACLGIYLIAYLLGEKIMKKLEGEMT